MWQLAFSSKSVFRNKMPVLEIGESKGMRAISPR